MLSSSLDSFLSSDSFAHQRRTCRLSDITIVSALTHDWLFRQALEWIHDTGEFYLSTHTSTGSSIHHTQELLKEHEDFQITAKVCAYLCLLVDWKAGMGEGNTVLLVNFPSFYLIVLCSLNPELCFEAHFQGTSLSSLLSHCYCVSESTLLCRPSNTWFQTLSFTHLPFLCGHYLSPPPPCMSLYWQQTKERVKLLIQLAEGFCDKGHAHALEIKKWVSSVDKRYRDFSIRMDKYRTSLETALGISSDSNKAVSDFFFEYLSLFCYMHVLLFSSLTIEKLAKRSF